MRLCIYLACGVIRRIGIIIAGSGTSKDRIGPPEGIFAGLSSKLKGATSVENGKHFLEIATDGGTLDQLQ